MKIKITTAYIVLLSIFILVPAYSADNDLSIQLRGTNTQYTVINTSNCYIYKLNVRSVPPKKEGVGNFFSRLGAEVAGIASFSKRLGAIPKGESITFKLSDLTNSDGRKLTSDYIIGSLKFTGSNCGECGLSVLFNAD